MNVITIIRYVYSRLFNKPFLPPEITIGENVYIGPNVKFDWLANGRLIRIGNNVTIADGTRIVCHDASSFRRHNITVASSVEISDGVYIGVNCIILPGVKIGNNSIVAAGAVVTNNVDPGIIVGGVPAKKIGTTEELDNKRLAKMNSIGFLNDDIFGKFPLNQELTNIFISKLSDDKEVILKSNKK